MCNYTHPVVTYTKGIENESNSQQALDNILKSPSCYLYQSPISCLLQYPEKMMQMAIFS